MTVIMPTKTQKQLIIDFIKQNTCLNRLDRFVLLVHRQVLLPHHKLQIVYDHMTDVIEVNSMLHGIKHCPIDKI